MKLDETVPLSAFFDTALMLVPAASTLAAEAAILNATIEAARVTRQVRAVLTVDAQAGVSTYDIPTPEGYTLAYVESVCVNGIKYTGTRERPCTPVEVCVEPVQQSPCLKRPACMRGFALNTACGSEELVACGDGKFYVADGGTTIILMPAPNADQYDAIEVELSVIPSRFSCVVPMSFFEQWKEEIGIGAGSKLLLNGGTFDRTRYSAVKQEWEWAKRRMKNRTLNNFTIGDESMYDRTACSAAGKLV